mmetsp:Transcript_4932/g.5461  ORF Transcript_4932/g.5461 Transcript_4932/m.5461 type:complete len:187 (-) Transcript_4932:116-676(-)
MKLILSLNEKDVDKDIDEDVDMDLEKDKFKGRLPAENVVPKIITTRKISTHFCRKDITKQRRIVLIVLLGVMTFSYSVYLMFSSAHVDRNVENGDDIANNEEDEYNKIIQTWSDIWDTADLRVPTSLSLDLDDDDDDLLTMDVQQLFRTFPSPTSTDTMKIYNKKAYLDLIKIFLQHQERPIKTLP